MQPKQSIIQPESLSVTSKISRRTFTTGLLFWGWHLVGGFASQTLAQPSGTPQTLEDAIAAVKAMKGQKSNAEIAKWLAETLHKQIKNINDPAGSQATQAQIEEWNRFANVQATYEDVAQWAWKNGVGQCGENTITAYYILKRAGVEGALRSITVPDGGKQQRINHQFLVWGIKPGANPDDPRTWGDDAIVIDGWQGKSMTRNEAWKNPYISDDGTRTMSDETRDKLDPEAPAWRIDPQHQNSIPATQKVAAQRSCMLAFLLVGTPLFTRLQFLRDFRDQSLARRVAGRRFIAAYYRLGPKWIVQLNGHEWMRSMARRLILVPAMLAVRACEGWCHKKPATREEP